MKLPLQSGNVQLLAGDRLVLVTDGVTGDYGNDIMSPEELGRIVQDSRPGREAQNLTDNARKSDDRTAIVVVA